MDSICRHRHCRKAFSANVEGWWHFCHHPSLSLYVADGGTPFAQDVSDDASVTEAHVCAEACQHDVRLMAHLRKIVEPFLRSLIRGYLCAEGWLILLMECLCIPCASVSPTQVAPEQLRTRAENIKLFRACYRSLE